jgi:hypothetical protein
MVRPSRAKYYWHMQGIYIGIYFNYTVHNRTAFSPCWWSYFRLGDPERSERERPRESAKRTGHNRKEKKRRTRECIQIKIG